MENQRCNAQHSGGIIKFPIFAPIIYIGSMKKIKYWITAGMIGLMTDGCISPDKAPLLPSWNDTEVRQRIEHFLLHQVQHIPIEDRIAVFDMDGTLVVERPFGIETVVSIHRLVARGASEPHLRQTAEYDFARRLVANARDPYVYQHAYDHGQNYFENIILKAFDGADAEAYVSFANHCLNTQRNPDYGLVYADMFYQPMLELIRALQDRDFEIFIVSASMQGLVWSICEQVLGLDRNHLIGIRHRKEVCFTPDGKLSYRLKGEMMQPVNNYEGKILNIYDHIGKIPVVAVGNAYSDFGMFRLTSTNVHPNLSILLHHDDADREYAYEPYTGTDICWQDTVKQYNWVQADMKTEFKTVWKK